MLPQSILNCSFPLWYPNFKHCSIESITLRVPKSFISYLSGGDTLFLPDYPQQTPADGVAIEPDDGEFSALHPGTTVFDNEFKEFHYKVDEKIKELGGSVFPKLNWSSPKDASWISLNNSLCCQNFNEICLLMKSSEFIMHDITNPFGVVGESNEIIDYTLVLRKWMDINPSGEYRCFIRQKELLAVSQRHMQQFSFIEQTKQSIIRKIKQFYKQNISNIFPEQSFVFDVYIPDSGKVLVLDFGPFMEVTDSFLFSWAELKGEEPMPEVESETSVDGVVFRCATDNGMVTSNDMRIYAYPVDFQHLSTGEDPLKLIDLLKLQQNQVIGTSDESD